MKQNSNVFIGTGNMFLGYIVFWFALPKGRDLTLFTGDIPSGFRLSSPFYFIQKPETEDGSWSYFPI
jgi:hypothetical protein